DRSVPSETSGHSSYPIVDLQHLHHRPAEQMLNAALRATHGLAGKIPAPAATVPHQPLAPGVAVVQILAVYRDEPLGVASIRQVVEFTGGRGWPLVWAGPGCIPRRL